MYIYVNFKDGDFERLDVSFKREYANTSVLPKKDNNVNSGITTEYMKKEATKFYERFLKLKETIEKHGKDNTLDFKFEGKNYHLEVCDNELIISSSVNNERYKFSYSYINKEIFILTKFDADDFENQIYSFDIQMGKCLEGDCKNHMDNYREMVRLYYEIMYEY